MTKTHTRRGDEHSSSTWRPQTSVTCPRIPCSVFTPPAVRHIIHLSFSLLRSSVRVHVEWLFGFSLIPLHELEVSILLSLFWLPIISRNRPFSALHSTVRIPGQRFYSLYAFRLTKWKPGCKSSFPDPDFSSHIQAFH